MRVKIKGVAVDGSGREQEIDVWLHVDDVRASKTPSGQQAVEANGYGDWTAAFTTTMEGFNPWGE